MKLKVIFLGLLFIFFNGIANSQNASELYTISVGKSVGLEDPKKFSPLLGYAVQFPENISSSLMLIDISLGVGLSKGVTQNEGKTLEEKMTQAIEDNDAFTVLKKYNPFRTMGGFYANKERASIIVVATMPTKAFEEVELKGGNKVYFDDTGANNFMIGAVKCFWVPPHEENKYHSFIWHKNGVSYMIFPIEGKDFTVDAAKDIAKKVMDVNK